MPTTDTVDAIVTGYETAFDAMLIFDDALTQESRQALADVIQYENECDLFMYDHQACVDLVTVLSRLDDSRAWNCTTMLHVYFPSAELAKHQLFHARLAISNQLRAYRYDEELISGELAEIAELAGSSTDTRKAALHLRDTALRIAIDLPALLDSDASCSLIDAANALTNSIRNNERHITNGINTVLHKLSIK